MLQMLQVQRRADCEVLHARGTAALRGLLQGCLSVAATGVTVCAGSHLSQLQPVWQHCWRGRSQDRPGAGQQHLPHWLCQVGRGGRLTAVISRCAGAPSVTPSSTARSSRWTTSLSAASAPSRRRTKSAGFVPSLSSETASCPMENISTKTAWRWLAWLTFPVK